MAKYTCTLCGKVFKESRALIIHIRSHTGERPYPCSFCQKAFSYQGNLTQHMLSHTGEKPHKCKECGEAFSRSPFLKQHMRNKHLQVCSESEKARALASKEARTCPDCGRTLASKQRLISHKKTQHGLASTSTATVVHSQTESVGEVTAVTHSVNTSSSVNTRTIVQSPLGRAEIVTQHFPTATVTTVTQAAAQDRTLTTPPVTLVSSLPVSSDPLSSLPVSSDPLSSDPLSSDPLSSDPLSSDPLSSDLNDISRLLPDSWLN